MDLILDNIGEVFFWTGIFLILDRFESTLEITRGNFIPGGYMKEFKGIEVDDNNKVTEIGGF